MAKREKRKQSPVAKRTKKGHDDFIMKVKRQGGIVIAQDDSQNASLQIGNPASKFINFKLKF